MTDICFSDAEYADLIRHWFGQGKRFLSQVPPKSGPAYLLDQPALISRAGQLKTAFTRRLSDVTPFYAVKSNNHPAVARILTQCGYGLDVSSGIELETALSFPGVPILFSGPGKTPAELSAAAAHSERVLVLVDSFGELDRLNTAAGERGVRVTAGIRLTTRTDGLWRKFGIPPEDLPAFMDRAERMPNVRVSGIQFHTSWNLNPDAQTRFIGHLGALLKGPARAFLPQIDFIDMGGGYWPEAGEWVRHAGLPDDLKKETPIRETVHYRLPATGIDPFAEALTAALKTHLLSLKPFRIFLEPGRWLAHDAMHLLLTVIDRKGDDLVITDGGTNAVGWERFETDDFPVLNLTRPEVTERACLVTGALCTPHDIWGTSYWGSDIRPGDRLLIPCQGAYTYSLRQHFIKPVPDVIPLFGQR